MKKNKITEIDGCGTFTDANVDRRSSSTTAAPRAHLRQRSSSPPARSPGWCPARRCQRERRHLRGADPRRATCPGSIIIAGAGAIGMEFAYVMKNYGVDVTIVEFLDRARAQRGRRGLQGDREAVQEARRQDPAPAPRSSPIEDNGSGVKVTVTVSKDGKTAGARGRQGAAGHRLRAATSRATAWRRPASRSPTAAPSRIDDYMRTNVPHIYAIGDVTAKLQLAHVAEARASSPPRPSPAPRRCAGRLPTDAARDVLPAAGRLASGSPRQQARDEGYDVKVAKFPFTANGKAHGLGDADRLRQAHRRRQVRRAARRPPDRPRRLRAAAGARRWRRSGT